jgi:hypothetical protein
LAHMAQCETTTIYVEVDGDEAYVDFASMMTAANRKQYHHVARDGTALCYRVGVTAVKGTGVIYHMQNQFAICNAVKQVTAGWKAQLKHAGIKLRDLSPYGRRPRFALEAGAYVRNILGITGEEIFEISNLHLDPLFEAGGASNFFTGYTATDGIAVKYKALAAPAAGSIAANQITTVTITDGAGIETNQPLVLSGAAVAAEFNVIYEYLKARRGSPDVSIDTPGPDGDSPMLNLFSISEEMSDDIVEGIDDYMDWKPYTPDHQLNTFDELMEGCQVDAATTATSQYPPVSAVFDAPCGLIKVGAADTMIFRFDILAIYEM